MLKSRIKQVHTRSRGTYGSPRIVDVLKRQGVEVGRRRIARLMREEGITGTLSRNLGAPRIPRTRIASRRIISIVSLIPRRQIVCGPPISVMCAPGKDGCMWPVVIDLFSRKVVGWSMQTHMKKRLFWMPCLWPSVDARHRASCCIIQTGAVSMRATPTARCSVTRASAAA